VKQKSIDFRELLERLLPLDELPPADRLHVQRALRTGVVSQLEQAALLALERLERQGAVRRIPALANGTGSVLRYQARDALDVFTIQVPGPTERDGVQVFPRASLPTGAQAGLDQVRRLLLIDDTLVFADAGTPGPSRPGLLEQLDQVAREFLGAGAVRFHPAGSTDSGPPTPLDRGLAAEARSHLDRIYYCPDTARVPRLRAEAERRDVRSVVVAGVPSSMGKALGHLEASSAELGHFDLRRLAMVALLADYCAGVLERAARIEKLVFVDPLTAAYNRSYFDLQLYNEMARAQRERSSVALCIADIDDFKSFNTSYGYEAGNQVLTQVARALRSGVRPFDTVARWGGE